MRDAVVQWRSEAFKTLRQKFSKRNIAMGELFESIAINIVSVGDVDISRIQFVFMAYGRFVDMGVGRGHPLGSRKESALLKIAGKEVGKIRKPKQFYTRDIFNQGHILHEILVEQYGVKMFSILENNLDGGKIENAI